MVFGYGTFPIVLEDSGLLEAVMLAVSAPAQHLAKWGFPPPGLCCAQRSREGEP